MVCVKDFVLQKQKFNFEEQNIISAYKILQILIFKGFLPLSAQSVLFLFKSL